MKSLNERSVARIKLILGWIAFAKRPLKKAEFRSALAFSGGNTAVSELPPPYIFEVCAPLVEERSDSSFAFIHVSVKEYVDLPFVLLLLRLLLPPPSICFKLLCTEYPPG